MKTDHIFYRIFKELPETFFQLWGESPENISNYRFDSVELKQTAFRIDGVLLTNDLEQPVYFTEVQFQKDRKFYLRLFSEILTYLRENDDNVRWRAMVLLKSRSIEPTVRERESVQPLLDCSYVKRIYLNELEVDENSPLGVQIIKLIVTKKREFLKTSQRLIQQVNQQSTEEISRLEMLNLIETIILAKLPKMSRKELEAMFGVDDLRKTRFAQELIEDTEQKTKIDTKLQLIPELLKRRFSVEEIADILQLDLQQVREAINNLN
jgi:predicted transposase/invertase (TIGR01784 family)